MDPPAVASAKAVLRREALARRDALDPEARAAASAAIAEGAIAIIEKMRPQCVAAYLAFSSEVNTGGILEWAARQGIATLAPVMLDKGTMVFRQYRAGDPLSRDAFGIDAPTEEASAPDPDLIIVPLSAFDRKGHRIGKGRGFYDRFVADLQAKGRRPLLVAVAFSVQEVSSVPHELHDIEVDWIVTERETLSFGQAG